MSLIVSPMSRAARRDGLASWMSDPKYTHAISLAPNRPNISSDLLKRMFGWFCLEVDRYMLGVKHAHLRNSHDRFDMIAMPEKLDVNPHLHGVANMSVDFWGERLMLPWESKLDQIWREVTRGSGEIDITDNDDGLAIYFTKEAFPRDHDHLHSWDFHRNDKLRKRPSATSLQRVAITRKAVLHS